MDVEIRRPTSDRGLTAAEAAARHRAGEGNVAVSGSSRSYASILRANVFSFFNIVLFVIGVALLALGRYSDALISVGLGLINALIGAVQEMRAKRKLDRLQLLDQTPVVVVRDGAEQEVTPDQVVRGDLLRIRAGDQIVVDGPLVEGGPVEADESLLTGESDPVVKTIGDQLSSGSSSVAGDGYQRAEAVGMASNAGRLTLDARRTSTDSTPLQRQIAFLVRLVIALTVLMSGAILAQAILEGFTLLRTVQITAVLSGLVPYGLFTLIAVAYTAGAVRIAGRGALVQQVNAVESVSYVDVVCTDKTGTLTTGRLTVDSIEPLTAEPLTAEPVTVESETVETTIGSYARSVGLANLTSTALATLPGRAWTVRQEVAFSSALRWSGLSTDEGTWVLGAPEALLPQLNGEPPTAAIDERVGRGLRVLIFARVAESGVSLYDAAGRARLPRLDPVALIALADELRPEVAETIARFQADGVAIKVISGDNPLTVAALAIQAGLPAGEPVSGDELVDLDDAALDQLTGRTSVFGRVAPEQKERIVRSLRRQGRYVAMLGDGVNDARALKAAQVGVAMRSGSSVTRDVADIVLTDDSFAALLPAQQEGRKIINGIATSIYVFLARVTTQGLVIMAVTMLGLGFPYSPTQVGLTLFTVGVPTLFLTWWARSDRPDPQLLRSVARFVVPAALITAGIAVAIYAVLYTTVLKAFSSGRTPDRVIEQFEQYTGLSAADAGFATAAATIGAQTGLTTFVSFASILLILFIAPPHRLLAVFTEPTRDRRPTYLVGGLLAVLTAVLLIPTLSDYFGLTEAANPVYSKVIPGLVIWFVALWLTFRFQLFDKIMRSPDRS